MDEHEAPPAPAPAAAASTLGTLIRQARVRARLSLRNLEAITGISRPMLNRLERDQLENPTPAVLQRVADALELDSDDLFAFVGYRPSNKLPSLAPYLRAKYQLPPDALAEASDALRDILAKYDQPRVTTPTAQQRSIDRVMDEP